MIEIIIKRMARFLASIFFLLTILFILFRVMPADPTSMMISERLDDETREALLEAYGLTAPLHEQYYTYMINAVQGDFGVSFHYREPVLEIIVPRLINTLIIVLPGVCVILLSAYVLGSKLGWEKGTKKDAFGSYTKVSFRAVPHFVLGLLFLMIFSYWLGLFPTGGMGPIQQDQGDENLVSALLISAHYTFLPFLAFTLHYMSDAFLLMRGNIIDEKDKDYINFYNIVGMEDDKIRKYAARNSLLPLVTYIPTLLLIAIGGQVLIEVVFSWQGIGELLVRSVRLRDYPLAQASLFFIGAMAILGNLIVDFLYFKFDPRIGTEGTE